MPPSRSPSSPPSSSAAPTPRSTAEPRTALGASSPDTPRPPASRGLPRVRQQVGKYRIERKLASGGFAVVYQALDTLEGVRVALKVPYPHFLVGETLQDVRKEVRLVARLDHPHICPLKNAAMVDGLLLIAAPLGVETLADRLSRRVGPATALGFVEQILEAVAFAHSRKLIHCDIKPENVIIFEGGVLKLTDFGIAKVAAKTRTLYGAGAGTIGYMAPEQALGRPSTRSDVFSLGLISYKILTGLLPSWPYDWPPERYDRLKRRFSPELIEVLRRALQVDHRKRFRDARAMLDAFRKARAKALRKPAAAAQHRRHGASQTAAPRWTKVRHLEFLRRYGRRLQCKASCERCGGPVSGPMRHCPWCGTGRATVRPAAQGSAHCKRCGRFQKSSWRFCAWCYGPGHTPDNHRRYSDKRYVAACERESCGGPLMPFMRYCPWCRGKVAQRWTLGQAANGSGGERASAREGQRASRGRKGATLADETQCRGCGWGVLPEFWDFCPWCGRAHRRDR